jgi:uncharacterized protein YciI
MADFVYLIHPLRDTYFDKPTAREEQAMDEHFIYLKEGTEQGVVLLAGPCLDETFDIVVLSAENEQTAREFMLNDPAVKSNVMMAELHPMKVLLNSLMERKC